MKELSIDELREIQIDLLRKFDELCTKHQLRYSMCGGTLLGAVRHKGYIPWDDDIDVMMPRPDYMKFLHIMDIYEDDVYGISSPYKRPEDVKKPYVSTYISFVNKKTRLIERATTRKIESHIYVDVFPIDGLPDSYEESVALYKKAKRLYRRYAAQKMSPYRMKSDTNIVSRLMWRGIYFLSKLLPFDYYFKKLDRLAQTYEFDTSNYVGDIVAGYGIKERIPKQVFNRIEALPFEGCKFCALGEYDTYLKALYGDYMQLPPKEKQVRAHDNIAYRC